MLGYPCQWRHGGSGDVDNLVSREAMEGFVQPSGMYSGVKLCYLNTEYYAYLCRPQRKSSLDFECKRAIHSIIADLSTLSMIRVQIPSEVEDHEDIEQ